MNSSEDPVGDGATGCAEAAGGGRVGKDDGADPVGALERRRGVDETGSADGATAALAAESAGVIVEMLAMLAGGAVVSDVVVVDVSVAAAWGFGGDDVELDAFVLVPVADDETAAATRTPPTDVTTRSAAHGSHAGKRASFRRMIAVGRSRRARSPDGASASTGGGRGTGAGFDRCLSR